MTLKAHYLSEGWEAAPGILQEMMGDSLQVTVGPDVPQPADFDLLVAGFPERRHLEASPRLRAVIVPFAGVPDGTTELLRQFPHVSLHNVHYNVIPTAEMAVALLLAAAKFLVPADRDLRRGSWNRRYDGAPVALLHGRNILILGYGQIGHHVAIVCQGLGMQVTGIRRNPPSGGMDDGIPVHGPEALAELLPAADVLMNVLPLTRETKDLIGAAELALLPAQAILVNAGRGGTVNEKALFDALRSGELLAAGIDVWYQYPRTVDARAATMPSAFPFHELDNVVMSPHRAGFGALDERTRMQYVAQLLRAAVAGQPIPNQVDKALGY